MAFFDEGSVPIFSTGALTLVNPTTATLIAEIDSSQFAQVSRSPKPYQVTWIVGASTLAYFTLEHVLSTGLGDTAIRCEIPCVATVNQSGQYMTKHMINPDDRLRVRVEGSTFTGNAMAKIFAEPLA